MARPNVFDHACASVESIPDGKNAIFMGFYATKCPTPFIFFDPHLQLFSLRLDLFFSQRGADAPIVVCVSHPNVSKIYTYIAIFFKKIPNK